MTNQPDNTNNLPDVLKRLASDTAKLEGALDQTIQALRKRGFQLSTDLGTMMRTLQQDIDIVQRNAEKIMGQQHQLEELVRTTALINSSLEIDSVLKEVMDTIIELTGAERAYLMLYDEATRDLRIKVARNWDRESLSEGEVSFSRSIVNSAMEQKTPILTVNALSDVRFQAMQSVLNNALRSILCVPLVLRGKIVGVLYADNRIGQGIFNQESVPLLTAFANQAAIAIENARAFGQVKSDLQTAQREVQILQIQIDQARMQSQIGEITETDYFQRLRASVQDIRRRGKSSDEEQGESESDETQES
jgi:GAF domain-containing protein